MTKRIISVITAAALLLSLFAALPLSAGAETSGDFGYSVDHVSKTAVITNYYGSETDISIPKAVDYTDPLGTITYEVTAIGASAFSGSSLEKVSMPDTVRNFYIREKAFYNCTSLAEISLNSVYSIDKSAFYHCSSLKSVSIPDTTVYIREGAFSACTALENVTIGNSVESIGNDVFSGCSSIKNLTIGNSVKTIGEYAFYYSGSLKSVTIPKSVEKIEKQAFRECGSLTAIKILNPELDLSSAYFERYTDVDNGFRDVTKTDMTVIGYKDSTAEAYAEKYGFTFIPLEEDTISGTTGDCTWTLDGTELTISGNGAMANYGYGEDNSAPWGKDITKVTITDGVTNIGNCAFFECFNLTSVSIGDTVTSIGKDSFFNCSDLTDIRLPDSLKSIGDGAFDRCSKIESIDIPQSVTEIGSSAFYRCNSLKSVIIPDSVTVLGMSVFSECESLTGITIGKSVSGISDTAFSGCPDLKSLTVDPDNTVFDSRNNCNAIIRTDSNALLFGCKNTSIPDTVTSISPKAFMGCVGLKEIVIPESVTEIGRYAFFNTGLMSVTIPKTVTNIHDNTYDYTFGYYSAGFSINKVEGFTIYGYPETEAERYADNNGFIFVPISDEPELVLGDANGDGEVDTVDATVVQRHATMIAVPYDEEQLMRADIDVDGELTIVDATFIQRYSTKIDTPYAIGEVIG